MSRRRGEFEHRTSIFEGAFRAWSHVGGLDPIVLETKTVQELDPLTNPLTSDTRLINGKGFKSGGGSGSGDDGSGNDNNNPQEQQQNNNIDPERQRREYPYEPLPRSGLAHPFVQAILSPWLGPDADQDAIQLGLTTLRTWWQHRRKGESGSAIAALGTDKMRGVVEGYTRHFFNLAYCLVVNDGEQPPRTLHTKLKEMEKVRSKRNKKRAREEEAGKLAALALNAGLAHGMGLLGGVVSTPPVPSVVESEEDRHLTPLERLHASQRRQLIAAGHISEREKITSSGNGGGTGTFTAGGQTYVVPSIDVKGKCLENNVDLPQLVDQVNTKATQLAYRGAGGATAAMSSSSVRARNDDGLVNRNSQRMRTSEFTPSNSNTTTAAPNNNSNSNNNNGSMNSLSGRSQSKPKPSSIVIPTQYGDPNTTPVVLVSANGDCLIALTVTGITCSHCVKIVETVLKGCNGNKSPIAGLLDAAADQLLNHVIIKIDFSSNAKRIAFEAARNLAMVGYTAVAKEMSVEDVGGVDKNGERVDLGLLSTSFEVVAATEPLDVFDWSKPCNCPNNGIARDKCPRHFQMTNAIFEAFDNRLRQVTRFISGTTDPKSSSPSSSENNVPKQQQQQQQQTSKASSCCSKIKSEDPTGHSAPPSSKAPSSPTGKELSVPTATIEAPAPMHVPSSRNNSVTSYGRHFSMTSETTFRRAMSGLSALSIDWENLEDFDVNIDHSAHINNQNPNTPIPKKVALTTTGGGEEKDTSGIMAGCAMLTGGTCNCGPTCVCVGCPVHDKPAEPALHHPHPPHPRIQKRSSLRKNNPIDPEVAQNMQVSFKV